MAALPFLMGRQVNNIQITFESCIFCKVIGPDPEFKHDIPSWDLPFHLVSVDMICSLPTAIRKYMFILIAFNHLTKGVEASSAAILSLKVLLRFF